MIGFSRIRATTASARTPVDDKDEAYTERAEESAEYVDRISEAGSARC